MISIAGSTPSSTGPPSRSRVSPSPKRQAISASTSSALQVKLLRVLEDRTFTPLGGISPVTVDVRVIAASHKNVPALVGEGAFREDLFYRLNIVKIELPSLNERREDIPLLVEHSLNRLNAHKGKAISGVSDGVLARLMNYDFPGNIRELENILEHDYILCRGMLIEEKQLPNDFIAKTNRHFDETTRSWFEKHGICVVADRMGNAQEMLQQYLRKAQKNELKRGVKHGKPATHDSRTVGQYGEDKRW